MGFMDSPPANDNFQIRFGGGGIIGMDNVPDAIRKNWIETALEWIDTGTEIQRHLAAVILEKWT